MKVLKSFDFGTVNNGSQSRYNWAEILDGKIRVYSPGEEFTCKPNLFRNMCRVKGAKVGKMVATKIMTKAQATEYGVPYKEGIVVVRAYEATKEQKEEIAKRLAARKARKAAKKAAAKAAAK